MDGIGSSATIFVVVHAASRNGCFGEVLIHEPLNDVDPVREKVCDLTPTEIQIGPPIPELLNIPIPPGARAEKLFPVEPYRLLCERCTAQMVAVSVPRGSCDGDLAQFSGIEIFRFGFDVVSPTALLHSDLNHAIVQPGSPDDLLTLSDGERQRLFDVDILSSVAGVNGDGDVPVIGCSNEDCIDILLSQQV